MTKAEKIIQHLLTLADIKINGNRSWDMKVSNDKLYSRILAKGNLGLGEAYMDGWWECNQLDEFFSKILIAHLESKVHPLKMFLPVAKAKIFNAQKKSKAFEVGESHYDIGNDIYNTMLDDRLVYTCGYWKLAENLKQAQEAKLDLVCKKIGLKKGQTVLDIGYGWGSFAKFAVENYGAKVVGVTISKEQHKLAKEICKGLDVDLRLMDYRDIKDETFDHIISLGMFEHVGPKNYKIFMTKVHELLKDNGLFLLHTIGGLTDINSTDAWIDKYIFTNGRLPSIVQIAKSAENLFIIEDWHSFGPDYDKTLMAWFVNFDKGWDQLKSNYNERFYRMWKYYLLSCAGSFRARKNQLWQIVLSKDGVAGGYNSIR